MFGSKSGLNKTDDKGNTLINSYEHNWAMFGDVHFPFVDERALDWCVDICDKHKLDKKTFTGDIWDNHAISFHESDPNGMSAKAEYHAALEVTKQWYAAFPEACRSLS